MDVSTLRYRKQKFHEEYQQRLASANGRQEAMARDLADFDNGINLLLHGATYRACQKEMPNFATVYKWILHTSLPLSFYESVTLRKNIDIPFLEESPEFAYLVGVYQATVRVIHPRRYTIETADSSLEHEVERCFRALHMPVQNKKIVYDKNTPRQRTLRRIYLCSVSLMEYILRITENNSRIPHTFYIPKLMKAYLSGFCDKGVSPSYSTAKSKCSSIIRKYPRIGIVKTGSVPLLSAINYALRFLGISSFYNPQRSPRRIYINSLGSIKKFIGLRLFRSSEKVERLKGLYNQWKETNAFDRYGAYGKAKEQIRLERLANRSEYVEPAPEEDDD